MRAILTRSNAEKGQVAFEFLLVFVFALGITFLFIYMSTNFVAGYFAHYATFMAGRTFLTADQPGRSIEISHSFAENRAREKFESYPLEVLRIKKNGFKIEKPGEGKKAIYVGATFKFEKLLSPFKAVGGAKRATLFTEALLGKEPTRRECLERVCRAITSGECVADMDITLFDNGC